MGAIQAIGDVAAWTKATLSKAGAIEESQFGSTVLREKAFKERMTGHGTVDYILRKPDPVRSMLETMKESAREGDRLLAKAISELPEGARSSHRTANVGLKAAGVSDAPVGMRAEDLLKSARAGVARWSAQLDEGLRSGDAIDWASRTHHQATLSNSLRVDGVQRVGRFVDAADADLRTFHASVPSAERQNAVVRLLSGQESADDIAARLGVSQDDVDGWATSFTDAGTGALAKQDLTPRVAAPPATTQPSLFPPTPVQ